MNRPAEQEATPQQKHQLPLYMGGVGLWFAAFGMQGVMFPWLIAVVLHETPDRVGWAQMATLAPALAFLLIGGAMADRIDGKVLLSRINYLAALPPLGLAMLFYFDGFTYPAAVSYALAAGTLSALAMPTRDTLLARVAGHNIQRAVIAMIGLQFGIQLVGAILAGGGDYVGAMPLLLAQAALLITAGALIGRLQPAVPATSAELKKRPSSIRQILDGMAEVRQSEIIFPIVIVTFFNGTLNFGAYLVALPLAIRDIYGGGSAEIAMAQMGFMAGTIVSTTLLLRFGTLRRPGQAFLTTMVVGGAVLAIISFAPPFPVVIGLMSLWGMGAGISMSMTRSIMLEQATASHRARVMSVFQLSFMGAGPLGTLIMGYLVASMGPLNAMVTAPVVTLIVVILALKFTPIWKIHSTSGHPKP